MPDVQERFRSLARTRVPDLWRDIEGREPGSLPAEPRGRRVLAGTVALLVAGAGIGLAIRALDARDVGRAPAAPGASRIVFAAASGQDLDMFSMEPDGTDVRRLTDTATSEEEPASSADGTMLAFALRESGEDASHVIAISDANGGEPREVLGTRLEVGNPVGSPTWSPDGSQIAFAAYGDAGGIYVADVDGGAARRLTSAGPPTIRVDSDPAWSPDGGSIAFIRWIIGDADRAPAYEMLEVAADGGEPALIARFPAQSQDDPSDTGEVDGLSWSPDGSRLAYARGGAIYAVDAESGESTELVACEELGCDGRTNVFTDDTSWSSDGRRIAFTASADSPEVVAEPTVYIADLDGEVVTVSSTGVRGVFPAWQPWVAGGTTASPTIQPSPSPPPVATVELTIEVGEASAFLYAAGSLWVDVLADPAKASGTLVRIDPDTGEVLARIPVDAFPDSESGGGGMAFDGRFLWIVGPLFSEGFDRGVLVRVDPETHEATTFDLPVGVAGSDLVFDGQSLWTTGVSSPGKDPRVLEIDPGTGQVVSQTPIVAEWWGSVVVIDGAIWVPEARVRDNTVWGPFTLVRIDPVTGDELASVSLEDADGVIGDLPPLAGLGEIWAGAGGGLLRIDPQSGQVLDRLTIRVGPDLEFGDDGSAWFLGGDRWNLLRRLNPVTGEVDVTLELERQPIPVAIAVAPAAVWVLTYGGALTRIALT